MPPEPDLAVKKAQWRGSMRSSGMEYLVLWEKNRCSPRFPDGAFDHNFFKAVRPLERRQPADEVGPILGGEPSAVGISELAHKGENGDVSHLWCVAEKVCVHGETIVEIVEEIGSFGPIAACVTIWEADRVFGVVEGLFEGAVGHVN
jgi:hypothetical protein